MCRKEDCIEALEYIVEEGIDLVLKNHGLSLDDFNSIGVAEELKKLYRLSYKFKAEEYLKLLREPVEIDIEFDTIVEWLKESVSEAGIMLKDIGTSEEEISLLRKQFYIYLSKSYIFSMIFDDDPPCEDCDSYLLRLRKYAESAFTRRVGSYNYLRECMDLGKISFEDCELPQKEVEDILRRHYIEMVHIYIKMLHESDSLWWDNDMSCLREILNNNVSLESLGLSEEVIKELILSRAKYFISKNAIDELRKYMAIENLSFADIGMDEKATSEMFFEHGKYLLSRTQESDELSWGYYFKDLQRFMAEGIISFEDLGVTEKEIIERRPH
ncbi:MAG: hypothetical protein PHW52_03640 [Candidatus Pacebacteria bacterium]|nr:hypothetical protein [Candidatus Paceibacterota bacterium]